MNRPQSLQDCKTFSEQLEYFHRKILLENIYDNWRDQEHLAGLIEAMTNIDTPEKEKIFNEICSVK